MFVRWLFKILMYLFSELGSIEKACVWSLDLKHNSNCIACPNYIEIVLFCIGLVLSLPWCIWYFCILCASYTILMMGDKLPQYIWDWTGLSGRNPGSLFLQNSHTKSGEPVPFWKREKLAVQCTRFLFSFLLFPRRCCRSSPCCPTEKSLPQTAFLGVRVLMREGSLISCQVDVLPLFPTKISWMQNTDLAKACTHIRQRVFTLNQLSFNLWGGDPSIDVRFNLKASLCSTEVFINVVPLDSKGQGF